MVRPAHEATGGDDALGRLYALHVVDARRFAYLLCSDADLAEDVVQESFERVARRLTGLRDPDAFVAYLRRTIRNLLRERARARSREQARVERYRASEAAGPHDPPESSTDSDLWAAIVELPERQRAALVCRYWLDLSTKDTARVLSCRPGTVKSLVARAVDELRRREADRGADG